MEKDTVWKRAWPWVRDLILPVTILYILAFQMFGLVIVSGQSMEPTYQNNEILFMNRMQRRNIKRGDVVVITADAKTQYKQLIKRVIAVAGDTIDISLDGERVTVNGKLLDEPYAVYPTFPGSMFTYPLTVPEGYVFVMGDNRPNSSDSRYAPGLIPFTAVLGKVM